MEKQSNCTSLDIEDLAEVESHEHSDYDDLDPKNWSYLKKNILFLALMSSSILADGWIFLLVACREENSHGLGEWPGVHPW